MIMHCLNLQVDRGDGRGLVWIFPASMLGRQRRPPRQRAQENLENQHQNSDNDSNEGIIENADHLDPNLELDSDNDDAEGAPNPENQTANQAWEEHQMRNRSTSSSEHC